MQDTVRTLYGPLMEAFFPFAVTLVAVWITVVGYYFLMGKLKETGAGALASALAIPAITTVIFTPYLYFQWVYLPATQLIVKLSGFFIAPGASGDPLAIIFTQLDHRWADIFALIEEIGGSGGRFDFTPYLFVVALSLIFGVLYAVFVLFMAMGFFGANVLLVLGGLFIFFLPFKSTRFMFSSWARALANYALIPIFTALVMAVTLDAVTHAITDLRMDNSGSLFSLEMGNAMLIGGIGIFFHLKASELAAALTGGQPAGMTGLLAMAPMAAAGLGAGIRFAGQASGANRLAGKAGELLGKGRDRAASAIGQRGYSALKGIGGAAAQRASSALKGAGSGAGQGVRQSIASGGAATAQKAVAAGGSRSAPPRPAAPSGSGGGAKGGRSAPKGRAPQSRPASGKSASSTMSGGTTSGRGGAGTANRGTQGKAGRPESRQGQRRSGARKSGSDK